MQPLNNRKLKVLLIAEQCNPEWPSVPLVVYNFFKEINQIAEVTLVTHDRNQPALEKKGYENIAYISESAAIKHYYKTVPSLAMKGRVNWPLYHLLSYPVYAEFDHSVYQAFKDQVIRGEYDVVHAISPIMPRYPYKIIKACQKRNIPFLLGPVNGGIPFPPGFRETAKQENASLNFLRALGRYLIPGYVETYKKSTRILSGSSYTLNLLQKLFALPDDRISLLFENGIDRDALMEVKRSYTPDRPINLLFVGRLVPYKCADVVIEAIGKLQSSVQNRVNLTIVGDGSEKASLEQMVQKLNLGDRVNFTGWVPQEETVNYYRKADVFCFPSIREFGGAVVIEAMACGLPSIVVDYGGIGEYVTNKAGFKIEPRSREYLVEQMTEKIKILVENPQLRSQMSVHAIARAKEFIWSNKALKIHEIYQSMLVSSESVSEANESSKLTSKVFHTA
ncbi:glycosyltransferase family 4 protein [Capilliphycus salinus ALCB114379]|uniref:glycosyltransferase family 4 protein n=1 Tax=Capilliphycus salinus TaxID=2768948 RepID=UPI0039A559FE